MTQKAMPQSKIGKLIRTTSFRLAMIYLFAFMVLSSILMGYIYWQTSHLFSRQILQRLNAEVQALENVGLVGGLPALARVIERRSSRPSASVYLLVNVRGEKLAGNISELPTEILNSTKLIRFEYEREGEVPNPRGGRRLPPEVMEMLHGGERMALGRVYLLPNNMRLLVGRDIGEQVQFRTVMRRALALGLLLTVLFGIGGGLIVSRKVLARIDEIDKTSRFIMAGDLSQRIPVAGSNDELDRLAQSLNAMLARIEVLMRGLKEVSDNIAHDLKTPLTRLRNQTEAALAGDLSEEAARASLTKTLEEADGLIATFNALLLIARAEAGSKSDAMAEFNAGDLVRDMAELYEPVAEEAGASLTVDAPEEAFGLGNRELIAQALSNLLDNALKYGLSGSAPYISLSLSSQDKDLIFSVRDNGSGISDDNRDRVMERFVRLDASRSKPGSGLGLSLVRAAAQFHGGKVALKDAAPGLSVELVLPILTKKKPQEADGGENAAL